MLLLRRSQLTVNIKIELKALHLRSEAHVHWPLVPLAVLPRSVYPPGRLLVVLLAGARGVQDLHQHQLFDLFEMFRRIDLVCH